MTAGIPSAPTIEVDPINQDLNTGDLLTITVTANGTPVLHYQWKNGIVNVGTDSPIFTKPNAQPADAGNYTCVVTNLYGNATSAIAVVTVVAGGALGPILDYYYNNLYSE
jgi:hypothetical protein